MNTSSEHTRKAGVWLRVSSSHQQADNQVPDLERFLAHHGFEEAERYEVSDSAWKNGGGPEYRATLQRALDDAWAGKFGVLIVWALDRIVRDDENGPEAALRIFRQFSERGCTLLSVKESWLNGSAEVQQLLIAFAGWMSSRESGRRAERIKAGLARRRREGKRVGGSKKGRKLKPGAGKAGAQARWANPEARRAQSQRFDARAAARARWGPQGGEETAAPGGGDG